MNKDSLTYDLNPHWYALYTKSCHEKFIRSELDKRKIESYLPVKHLKRRWSDRTVTTEEPLFKSYLFVKTDLYHFTDVLKVKGAVKFVSAGTAPVPIQNTIIDSLRMVVQPGVDLDPFPYLKQGDRVYVRSGLFKGLEGFIVRKDNDKCRLVISVNALMASISVQVDSSLVEKL